MMPEMDMKRKAEEFSMVPSKRTRHEITVVGTREKAVVTSSVKNMNCLLFVCIKKPN